MTYRAALLLTLCLALAMGIVGTGAQAQQDEQTSLGEEFGGASARYGVPEELLKAMGYVNTRWEMPPPDTTPYEKDATSPRSGNPHDRGAYGLMQLQQNPSKDTVGRAAELTGLTEEEIKSDRAANVRGGAAVLADIAGEEKPSDLDGWFGVVAEYGGSDLYAEEVFAPLKSGASGKTSAGEKITLNAQDGVGRETRMATKARGQYRNSTWYGNNGRNYTNASRGAAKIDKIVIHVAQGSYSGTLSWFNNPSNTAGSAHYTVSERGAVGQSVSEQDIAWHAGWWATNKASIGIEHAGYVSQPNRWFTEKMYRSSAKLTAYLSKKYGVPRDRKHIIAHSQVPGCSGPGGGEACHTDPGSGWNWGRYMKYVKSYAGSGGGSGPYTQVVDNASSRFEASGRWISSDFRQQQSLGNNHRVLRTPLNFGDNARFRIKTPARDKYTVYARWPADDGYNYKTTFWVLGIKGWNREVRTQRANGGKWVKLGDYTFPKGDSYRVQVSSKSPVRGYIVADGVMIVRR